MGNKGQATILPGTMTKMNRARMSELRRNTYVNNSMEAPEMPEMEYENTPNFNGSKIVNNYRAEMNTIIPGETNPALAELREEPEKSFFDFSSMFSSKGGRKSRARKTHAARKTRVARKTRAARKSRDARKTRAARKSRSRKSRSRKTRSRK
jgi:hypothetical protein